MTTGTLLLIKSVGLGPIYREPPTDGLDLGPVHKQSQVNYNEIESSVQVNELEFHWLNLSPSSFLFGLTLFVNRALAHGVISPGCNGLVNLF